MAKWTWYTNVWITFILMSFVSAQASPRGKQKNVLVFGGNGFLGAETVSQLLAQQTQHRITLVSRGNWYWDSTYRVKPYVNHLKCDRMQTLRKCKPFMEFMNSMNDLYFDAVLDFSGYHPFSVEDALFLLLERVRLYVYISTDSVYEVFAPFNVGENGIKESDGARPESFDEQNELNSREDYGHRKLECEEALIKAHKGDGTDYVILRLPDIIGPRDTTYRWWVYQLWIRLHKYLPLPVSIPTVLLDRPLSLVFVEDVASIIVSMVTSDQTDYFNDVYNLAFSETPTLKELLDMTASKLNMSNLLIGPTDADDSIFLYPSVSRGFVNTDKAIERLGWFPTRLDYAVTKTVQFYEEALHIPHLWREKNEVLNMIQGSLTHDPKGNSVRRAVLQEYGIDLSIAKDEL